MEVEIDKELSSIIARRQPTARDLRLLIAISKTTANLERAGDEADKIARMVKSIIESGAARNMPASELRMAADLASGLLRKALDAFARLDVTMAVSILKEDDADRQGIRRLCAQAHHLHDGRPAHHLASLDLLVPGQGHRAHWRPCQEHCRVHHLHRQGCGRAPHADGDH
jgi:phosphate transport system protein